MSDFPFGRQPPQGPPPYEAVVIEGGVGIISFGLAVNQPAFGNPGAWYFQTDTGQLNFDTGTSWETVATAGSGGAVSSVTAGDGTLTIAPTTGAVVAAVGAVPQSKVTGLVAALALLAPLASPTFTGEVIVPSGTNPTDAAQFQQIAAASATPAAMPTAWNTAVAAGTLATHQHGTMLDPTAWGYVTGNPGALGGSAASTWQTANNAVYTKCEGSASVTNFNFVVSVSSGNMDIGIYSNSGAGAASVPNTRVAHKGSTAVPTAGNITMAVGTVNTMVQGQHWFAFAFDNTTVSNLRITMTNAFLGAGNNQVQATAFPLPSPAASLSGNIYSIAMFST